MSEPLNSTESKKKADLLQDPKPRRLRWSRQSSVQIQVFIAWILITCLFFFSKAQGLSVFFWGITAVFCWVLLSPYIQGPYLLYTRPFSAPLFREYRLITEDIQSKLNSSDLDDLKQLGFELAGYLAKKVSIATRVAILINPHTKDSAQVARIVSGLKTVDLVVFKSRFSDHSAFETNNGWHAGLFVSDPNFKVFKFPRIESISNLYCAHLAIKASLFMDRIPMIADKEGEITAFIGQDRVTKLRQIEAGHYKLRSPEKVYGYTWKGAIRYAWLLAWPVNVIRRQQVYKKSYRMAKELGFEVDLKTGRIRAPKSALTAATAPESQSQP